METGRLGNYKIIGVLLDTNVLLYAYDGLDIFEKILNLLEDYKPMFFIHEKVLQELNEIENIGKRKQLLLNRIRIARVLLEKYRDWWKIISDDSERKGEIDQILIDVCLKYGLWLVTSDYKLRLRALKKGVTVIYVVRHSKRVLLEYPNRLISYS